ncbi:MAG: Rid family detoxifying hydrolase [Gemmatimonadota bacterium]|nr:Rid family detoxifying hydrolase [Gemmatimonadota bacterium]
MSAKPGLAPAQGPYSPAVKAGGFIFTSGQIPVDPELNKVIIGSIEEMTTLTLKNLEAALIHMGAGLKDVVKTTVFLSDMSDFAAMNKVYIEFFAQIKPARSTVAVKELPMGIAVEIEAVALDPATGGNVERL